MFEMIANAVGQYASLSILAVLLIGTLAGILGGSLPGISPSMTIALIFPITLYMEPVAAIAILLGAYQGAMMGGSISAILINTPGTASAAGTVLDGYPMSQKGQARKALQTALYSSVFGGIVGTIILLLAAEPLAKVALAFGPPEYFGIMLFSLTMIAAISGKSLLKGVLAACFEMLIAMVGLDPVYGTQRFTFGVLNLYEGFNTLSVFIGSFAVSELLLQLGQGREKLNEKAIVDKSKSNRLSAKEFFGQTWNIIRSGIIGAGIGILPGIGGSTASFLSYATAKKRSKYPEKFGTGIIDGVACCESSNNAVCGGALVPMLTLGIPGDVTTAILSGAFIAQGIKPGPLLFTNNLNQVYDVYVGMIFAILALLIIGTLTLPVFSRVVSIRKSILLPCVFFICFIGTYASKNSYFGCYMMLAFGFLGFLFKKFKLPMAPMIIAFVIGSSFESNFRRSFLLGNVNWTIFFTRPLSLAFIIIAVVVAVLMVRSNYKQNKKTQEENK